MNKLYNRFTISNTTLQFFLIAHKKEEEEREQLFLFKEKNNNAKECSPTYKLLKTEFNSETRITKLQFLKEQQYRTIERYVTQNYVRYPIYSHWKVRSKIIYKTIKLTNQELENLLSNSDDLVSHFAVEIIASLKHEELLPSWFICQALGTEYSETLKNLKKEGEKSKSTYTRKIHSLNIDISQTKSKIANLRQKLVTLNKQCDIVEKKLNKITTAKKSFVKSFFTLFIYNLLISNKRKNKILAKCQILKNDIKTLNEKIEQYNTVIANINEQINENNQKILECQKEIDTKKAIAEKEYFKKLRKNKPLPQEVDDTEQFIPLNALIGLEYKKIIGCYIIHNKIYDKYYVGQSKDIIKRIKQHFRGTVPNNITFAEDYYNTPVEERNNMFEIKIIECETKDELDRTEKSLIESYNSFKLGYNHTKGNS